MKLQNKLAVITGGASGMGEAMAKRFAAEGAMVIAANINKEGAQQTVESIKQNQGQALAVTTDVTKPKDIENGIDAAVKTYGTLDILINNAGIIWPAWKPRATLPLINGIVYFKLTRPPRCKPFVIPCQSFSRNRMGSILILPLRAV